MLRFPAIVYIILSLSISAQCFARKKYKTKIPTANSFYIIVDKSDNTLTVYDSEDWIVQYPCTFGSDDLGDKMTQGDRRTPEGKFHITSKYYHKKWNRFLMLDYPTKSDYEKFNQRKAAGLIPRDAKIGGDIGIHGTWRHEEWAVENLQPWTQGCVSMKNEDVKELYDMIAPGTVVIIRQ